MVYRRRHRETNAERWVGEGGVAQRHLLPKKTVRAQRMGA
jgi:hypothetical protein